MVENKIYDQIFTINNLMCVLSVCWYISNDPRIVCVWQRSLARYLIYNLRILIATKIQLSYVIANKQFSNAEARAGTERF